MVMIYLYILLLILVMMFFHIHLDMKMKPINNEPNTFHKHETLNGYGKKKIKGGIIKNKEIDLIADFEILLYSNQKDFNYNAKEFRVEDGGRIVSDALKKDIRDLGVAKTKDNILCDYSDEHLLPVESLVKII